MIAGSAYAARDALLETLRASARCITSRVLLVVRRPYWLDEMWVASLSRAPLSKSLALFGEYRYSHTNPDFDFQNLGNKTTVDTDLNTHHFLLGLNVKF